MYSAEDRRPFPVHSISQYPFRTPQFVAVTEHSFNPIEAIAYLCTSSAPLALSTRQNKTAYKTKSSIQKPHKHITPQSQENNPFHSIASSNPSPRPHPSVTPAPLLDKTQSLETKSEPTGRPLPSYIHNSRLSPSYLQGKQNINGKKYFFF